MWTVPTLLRASSPVLGRGQRRMLGNAHRSSLGRGRRRSLHGVSRTLFISRSHVCHFYTLNSIEQNPLHQDGPDLCDHRAVGQNLQGNSICRNVERMIACQARVDGLPRFPRTRLHSVYFLSHLQDEARKCRRHPSNEVDVFFPRFPPGWASREKLHWGRVWGGAQTPQPLIRHREDFSSR